MNPGMMSSKTSEWATPLSVFVPLDAEFGFTWDVCATRDNAKCVGYYHKDEDGLSFDWSEHKAVWCNPPYGRQIGKWIRKAYETSLQGTTVVCLVPARTDSAWFHDYAMKAEIRFARGRIYFERPDGTSDRAPFPSAVLVFRGKKEV